MSIEAALALASDQRDMERINDKRVKMRCPNPQHVTRSAADGGTPSFYLWTQGPRAGQGKCYGCGITPTWREVCELLKLPRGAQFLRAPLAETIDENELASMMGRARPPTRHTEIPWPSDRVWRGIPGPLVTRMGGIVVPGRRDNPTVLRLPCYIRGNEVGHTDCTLEKPLNPEDAAYIFSSGTWVQHALYPYDYVRNLRPRVVVIVEGVRDALTTIRNGALALCTFGSNNWSHKCARLLQYVNADCIVVMADPDDAGEHLRRAVHRDFGKRYDVRHVVLPSEMVRNTMGLLERKKLLDPGDLNRADIHRIMQRIGIVKNDRNVWVPRIGHNGGPPMEIEHAPSTQNASLSGVERREQHVARSQLRRAGGG